MNYEFILKYYKSFCTKVSAISKFFSGESSFFFVGDFGKVFVAYGGEQIQDQIIESFWKENDKKALPIGYNINIEQKERSVCVKPGMSYVDSEVAIVVIGTIKAVYSSEDIRFTKLKGRKFAQTFLLQRNNENHYCKSTVLAYLAPSDLFDDIINSGLSMKMRSISSFAKNKANQELKQDYDNVTDDKINVQNVDENVESDGVRHLNGFDGKRISDLLPISLNELFVDDHVDNSVDNKNNDNANIESFEKYQYLNNIWSRKWENNYLNHCQQSSDSIWIDNIDKNDEQSDANQNSSTSFADALRNGLQHSWQNYNKLDDKTREIRIIQSCSKSRYKQNWQNSNKTDRRSEFIGPQNITIIGAQNLEDIHDTSILFVANIPLGVSKTDFMDLFNVYGKVLSMKFVERAGVSFAFVYFECKSSVDTIINSSTNNSINLSGLQLKIDRYKKRAPNLSNQARS